MKATESPRLVATCMKRARGILSGEIELPAIRYDSDRSGIHASDLTTCPASAFYEKTLGKDAPPNNDQSILHFTKGRAMERFFMEEQERIIVDGISCTADGFYPGHGYLEFKATAEQLDFFDPLTAHPEWIERILTYCVAYKQTFWNLVIFFIVGNMPNRLFWNIREFGKSTVPYKGIDLRSWRLDFTKEEIDKNWEVMCHRKRGLEECLKTGIPPSKEWIDSQVAEWQHKICRFKDICEYLKDKEGT